MGVRSKKGVPESKHVSKKKKSGRSEKSQPTVQGSQDSQASDRRVTCATGASQETPAESTGRCTQHKKKAKKKKSASNPTRVTVFNVHMLVFKALVSV